MWLIDYQNHPCRLQSVGCKMISVAQRMYNLDFGLRSTCDHAVAGGFKFVVVMHDRDGHHNQKSVWQLLSNIYGAYTYIE